VRPRSVRDEHRPREPDTEARGRYDRAVSEGEPGWESAQEEQEPRVLPPRTAPEATAALVLGIVAMLGMVCLAPVGGIVAVVGLVLGYRALEAIKAAPERLGGRGVAIGGLVLSGIAFVLSLVGFALLVLMVISGS